MGPDGAEYKLKPNSDGVFCTLIHEPCGTVITATIETADEVMRAAFGHYEDGCGR